MYRFSHAIKRIVLGAFLTAVVVLVALIFSVGVVESVDRISAWQNEAEVASKDPALLPGQDATDWDVANSIPFYEPNEYISCADGASSKMLADWLVPLAEDVPEKCVPMNEVVAMVQRELPGLHASITAHNFQVDTEWAVLQHTIESVAFEGDPLTAANRLLDMECGDRESLMATPIYRWTLFRNASPETVRDAVATLYTLHSDGWNYSTVSKMGPYKRGDIQPPEEFYYEYFGKVGNMAESAVRLIEAFYEAKRVQSDSYELLPGFQNGSTGMPCRNR